MTNQPSLVLQLQELATDKSNDITDLLRKALLVATKLRVKDFKDWIHNELYGYGDQPVPDYRTTTAQLKAINPYQGLIPFVIPDPELYEKVSRVVVPDGMGRVLALLAGDGQLRVTFSDPEKAWLMHGYRGHDT